MVCATHWKYWITGALSRDGGGPVSEPYEVIVESGIRDSASALALRGVGAAGCSDHSGRFKTSFSTQGADHPPSVPTTVSVFVRESRGKWRPYVVPIAAHKAHALSPSELAIDLGLVEIGASQALYASEA